MGVSYLRSKLPILIKFVASRPAPLSNFHGRFSFLPRHCVSSLSLFKQIDTHKQFGNGVRHYHGKGLVRKSTLSSIVLSSGLGTGIPLRSLVRKPGFIKAGLAFLGIVLFVRLERIPYSNRYHLVFSCKPLERYIGKLALRSNKDRKLFPPNDKRSARVHKVLEDIVGAMNADLRLKKEATVVFRDKWFYGWTISFNPLDKTGLVKDQISNIYDNDNDEKMAETTSFREIKGYSRERRVKEFKFGPFGTKHLEGLQWEVRVMDSYGSNAFYTTRGKIVVYTGLLRELKSDAELATVLAHEVGHGVAQHINDQLMKLILASIFIVILQVQNSEHLLKPIFAFLSRRKEMEADYIGLMLMASAGYEPRTAPKVFEEKLGGSDCSGLYDTHPTGKKRADKLRKPKVMAKAIEIYKEAKLCPLSIVEGSRT